MRTKILKNHVSIIICLLLFKQAIPVAVAFALPKAGNSIAAKIAIIAMSLQQIVTTLQQVEMNLFHYYKHLIILL